MDLSDNEGDTIWGHNFVVIIVALFVLGFMSIFGYLLLSNIITSYATSGHYSATAAGMAANYLSAQRMFDYVIVILMVVMLVALGITSYRIFAPPVFFAATLVMGFFYGLVGYFFSYMFQEIMGDAAFAAVVGTFPNTILLCTNLHWVGLAALVVGSITLYAKRRQEEVAPLE